MKCIILAAGYATRMYPLTENFPKPLLTVGGKTIIDHLLADIDGHGCIDEYIVISNHKFINIFNEWAAALKYSAPVTVIDDGTTSNETRLGAVKDIQLAVDTLHAADDLLVFAGDNVLDFSLRRLLDYFHEKNASCVMRYYEPSVEKLKKTGVASIGPKNLIESMIEKPENPASHWCIPPFYIYKRDDVPRIKQALEEGMPYDAPGSFIAWLSAHTAVYAMEMPGRRYDVGSIEGYEQIKQGFK